MNIIKLVSIIFAIVGLSACSIIPHMHVPSNAKLANQLKDDFSNVTKNNSNIFTGMLEKKEKVEAIELLSLKSTNDWIRKDIANAMHTTTWLEISGYFISNREKYESLKKRINDSLVDNNDRISQISKRIKSNEKTFNETKQLLAKLAVLRNQWYARHEFFRQSIKSIADISVAKETHENFNLEKALSEASNNVLNSKITVVDENGNEKQEKDEIRKHLGIDDSKIDKDSFIQLTKSFSGEPFKEDSAPGIKIIVLSLAVDLAEKELKRNKLDMNYLRAIKDIRTSITNNDSSINHKIKFIDLGETLINRRIIDKNKEILTTLNMLRKKPENKDSLIDLFKVVGLYSIVKLEDASYENSIYEYQLATLDHEYSIRLSAINAEEHEALISRGLQGLASYHGGGITPETIANFIRAAQAAALGVIGAGVL